MNGFRNHILPCSIFCILCRCAVSVLFLRRDICLTSIRFSRGLAAFSGPFIPGRNVVFARCGIASRSRYLRRLHIPCRKALLPGSRRVSRYSHSFFRRQDTLSGRCIFQQPVGQPRYGNQPGSGFHRQIIQVIIRIDCLLPRNVRRAVFCLPVSGNLFHFVIDVFLQRRKIQRITVILFFGGV